MQERQERQERMQQLQQELKQLQGDEGADAERMQQAEQELQHIQVQQDQAVEELLQKFEAFKSEEEKLWAIKRKNNLEWPSLAQERRWNECYTVCGELKKELGEAGIDAEKEVEKR